MKIKDFLVNPNISDDISEDDFEFLTEYRENHGLIDAHYSRLYGTLMLDESLVGNNDPATKQNVARAITSTLYVHRENINRLYKLFNEDYEPLANVDGTTTTTFSEFIKIDEFGQHKTDNFYDENSTTNKFGESTTLETLGNTESNTLNSKYGFNEGTSVPNDSQTITSNTVQNMTTVDPIENNSTTEAHTDSITSNAHTDTYTENEHTITERKIGNQGVTKTQDMFNDDYNLWNRLNFFDYVYKLIYEAVTIPSFE